MVDSDAPGVWQIWAPGTRLAGFMKGLLNIIKALGLMVSEKIFYVFPIITLWELSVAMETAFFPTPTMLQIKFVCDRSACLRDIYVGKCGYTDTHTDTHRRRLDWYTIS